MILRILLHIIFYHILPCWIGLVVSVSASYTVGCGFVLRQGHTKDQHKNGTNCLPAWHTCIRVVCGTVYVDMHFKDLSRVLCPGFLSSATWPLMQKKAL